MDSKTFISLEYILWKSIEYSTYSDLLNMLDKFVVEEGLADNKDVKYIVSALHELEEFFGGNEKMYSPNILILTPLMQM